MIYESVTNNIPSLDEELRDTRAVMESFLLDDLSRLNDEQRQAVIESDEMNLLINEGMIAKRSIVRLSKQDDLFRRKKIISLNMAKEKNDRLYDLVVKYRMKEREAMGLIVKKYGNKAERVAKVNQKEYLKTSPISQRIVAGPQDLTKKKIFDPKTAMMKAVSTRNEEDD